MKIKIILSILIISLVLVTTTMPQSIAQKEDLIPDWIETTAGFWVEGRVGDQEFINAMKHLIEEGIIVVSQDKHGEDSKQDEIAKLKDTISELESKVSLLQA